MMPTEVVMAMAVESAPTRTEVRRSDEARLRDASMASTPAMRRNSSEETAVRPLTSAGMAKAEARDEAAVRQRSRRTACRRCAGANEAARPGRPARAAIHRSRILWTRAAYSRSPRAMASTGETSDASRAGEAADASETPTPMTRPEQDGARRECNRRRAAADIKVLDGGGRAAARRRSPSAGQARCPARRPTRPKQTASPRKAVRTAPRLAPRARTIPISGRRRTTETEMVLKMRNAPTTSAT